MEKSQNVGTKSAFKVYHAIKKNTRHMGSKFIEQKHYVEKNYYRILKHQEKCFFF